MELEQQVLACSREYALFSPGDRVAVAVSGGADSMALLTLLWQLRHALGITVTCAHFHHGLRGKEADRDLVFVRSWCREHGIECTVGRGDAAAHAARTRQSAEAAARELRYAFFDTLPADLVATAHNADDNAETVLLHLLRGAGTRGFAGIPPKRGRFVRPLLFCTREQILRYLTERGIPHVEDGTNAEDGCVRNRLRHHVMPLLCAENPNFQQTVLRASAIVRQEDDFLSALARDAAERCKADGGWSCARLSALDPVLRRRALLGILQALPLQAPTFACVQALETLLAADCPSASFCLPEGWVAQRVYDKFCIIREKAADSCPELPLKIPGDTDISEIGRKIRATVTENSNFTQKNLNTFALRYDMISASSWTVRARRTGDELLLPGGHRTLKRLMIDRKIPAAERDRYPVVLCGGRVAAVLGLACSEAFRAEPGKPAVELTLLPLEPPPADISANAVLTDGR